MSSKKELIKDIADLKEAIDKAKKANNESVVADLQPVLDSLEEELKEAEKEEEPKKVEKKAAPKAKATPKPKKEKTEEEPKEKELSGTRLFGKGRKFDLKIGEKIVLEDKTSIHLVSDEECTLLYKGDPKRVVAFTFKDGAWSIDCCERGHKAYPEFAKKDIEQAVDYILELLECKDYTERRAKQRRETKKKADVPPLSPAAKVEQTIDKAAEKVEKTAEKMVKKGKTFSTAQLKDFAKEAKDLVMAILIGIDKAAEKKTFISALKAVITQAEKQKLKVVMAEGGNAEIEVQEDSDDEMKLEYIGELIRQGNTTGYSPYWHLKTNFEGEIDDSDREHIAKQVMSGVKQGEIVSGEEEKTGWWSIEIGEQFASGGNIYKQYDFESMEQYFDYIAESYTNGQMSQVKSLYSKMSPAQRSEFMSYAQSNGYNEAADYINENVRKYDEGGKLSKSIMLEYWSCDVYADSYEEGEGDHLNTFDGEKNKTFDSPEKMIEYIEKNITFKDDFKKGSNAFEDGRITYSSMVGSDNTPASKSDLELFAKGEKELFSAHFDFYIKYVEVETPSVEQLSKDFGIEQYAEGGTIDPSKESQAVQGYLEAAIWASGEEFDEKAIIDMDKATFDGMKATIEKFMVDNADLIKESGLDDSQVGHDLWLTQNHHGAGFFDRGLDDDIEKKLTKAAHALGENDLYIGDDGKIYSSKFAQGGKVNKKSKAKKEKYTAKFKEVYYGDDFYYIRTFGEVETDKKVKLLCVAHIQNLEDAISADELPEAGNWQLSMSLMPEQQHISKSIIKGADDANARISDNTVINVENYMGGLNYEPQETVFFKTSEEAKEYLMSEELNDQITAEGKLSGMIMDRSYNRIGDTNWDKLNKIMTDKFAEGGNADYERGKNYSVKTLSADEGKKVKIDEFPNFSKTGSVKGMKKMYYGKDALLVRCGSYIYNVSSDPKVYFDHAK